MKTEIQTRIDQIRRRFEEYLKHKNDPYSYYPGEIEEVREFNSHAVEDVEFLLDLADGLLIKAPVGGMIRGQLLKFLKEEVRWRRKKILASVERNRRRNTLSEDDLRQLKNNQRLTQKLIDATLVDFINGVATDQGEDCGLTVRRLKRPDRPD